MAKITGRFKKSKVVSRTAVSQRLYARLTVAFRQAVRQMFVEMAEEVKNIESGMSLGSIAGAMQEAVGSGRGTITPGMIETIAAAGHPVNKKYDPRDAQFGGPFDYRSFELGQELGRPAVEVDIGSPSDLRFSVQFQIPVLQYYLFEAGIAHGKWNTLDVARRVFPRFLKECVTTEVSPGQLKVLLAGT